MRKSCETRLESVAAAILLTAVIVGALLNYGLLPRATNIAMAASETQSDTPYQSGPFKVGVAISPEKPVVGSNALRIVLHDLEGDPVSVSVR